MIDVFDENDRRIYYNEMFKGNKIHPTAIISKDVEMGTGNEIGPHCIIGFPAEHKGFWDKPQKGVKIGNNNKITGLVTIDSGTERDTTLGDNCWLLKHSHVGHDAEIGDDVTISCGAKVGGHAIIHSGSNLGLNSCIHQRVRVPEGCMIGMNAAVTKKTELQPFRKYAGVPAKDIGSNLKEIKSEPSEIVGIDTDRQGFAKAMKDLDDLLIWGHFIRNVEKNPLFSKLGESNGKIILVLKDVRNSPVLIYNLEEGKLYTSGLGLLCPDYATLVYILKLLGHNI